MNTPVSSDPSQVEANYSFLASTLSEGRRQGVRLISGPERSFRVSPNLSRIHLPFPPLDNSWNQRTLTCGVALQTSPSKERLAQLPINELTKQQQLNLLKVEGGVALSWAIRKWPGLRKEFRKQLPDLKELDCNMDASSMLNLAIEEKTTFSKIPKYLLLGELAIKTGSQPGFINSLKRLYGRMPWSTNKRFSKGKFSIPAGGDGNVQNPNLPPPSRPENDDPIATINQRQGIPYPEWNVWTNAFHKNYVAVLERKVTANHPMTVQSGIDLQRWFNAPTHRCSKNRMEDGSDLDIDQYINQFIDTTSGVATDNRVFRDLVPKSRDVTTAVLLDGSASLAVQQGRIFKLELACADALSRAMELAKEPHGIFVFTGHTRHRVDVICLKDFAERNAVIPGKLGLTTGGYTRLGAPIRHMTQRLIQQRSERRVLIIIGDGLMSDEGYEGYYAWADVAHALEEAEDAGVFPYYIGIGPARVDPLPDVFGARRSKRISRVEDLPKVLAHVHHQLVAA